ncbi:MAG TPA: hypothetical protein PKB04_09835, partial [Phenylobacterium sp.]|nr:hypothetical protein [Phenylobacterium sp.]
MMAAVSGVGALQLAAEQTGGRGRPRPGEGNQGEGRRAQRAKARRTPERLRIDGEQRRNRQVRRQEPPQEEGRRRPQNQTDPDPQEGQDGDLDEIGVAHQHSRGTKGLQNGDGWTPGLQKGAHRALHAQAAGQQRGQADEGQEVLQLIDQPPGARGGLFRHPYAHVVAQDRLEPGLGRVRRLIRRQNQPPGLHE